MCPCYRDAEMRLTTIRARDFLSFDELSLALAPELTVIVGPNGAGKSNVIRALQLVRLAVAFAADQDPPALQRLAVFAAARRAAAAPDGRTTVALGVELDSGDERGLVGDFVRAAAVSGLARESGGRQVTGEVLRWIDDQIRDDALGSLLTGELIVEVPRDPDDGWEVVYQFAVDETTFAVDLTGGLGAIRDARDDRRDGLQYMSIGGRLGLRADAVDQAKPFSVAKVLPELRQLTGLSVEPYSGQSLPEALRRFNVSVGAAARAGLPRSYGLASVLSSVLQRGITILSEARLPPRSLFPATGASGDDDRSWLPLRLFEFKNGNANARQRFEAVRATYAELVSGPSFDLTAAREAQGEQPGGPALRINLVLPGPPRDIPIEFAGMGAWEAVALSTVLADRQGGALALDEPAVNLHPVAQRRLLTRLQADAGQSIVVTHSPYLVPAGSRAQLAQIVRIDRTADVSRVHRLEHDVDDARSSWVKELADSADTRALLFAAGVILLEGDTELGALTLWFGRCAIADQCGSPEQLNVSLVNVGGDRNFRTFIEICRLFNIPWAAICDGAALDASRAKTEQVLRQLVAAGAGDELLVAWLDGDPVANFQETRNKAEHWGIFTLARGPAKGEEGFEAFLELVARDALKGARQAEPDSKPRQGRWLAEQIECPPEVDELYAKLLRRLRMCERGSSTTAGRASP